MPETTSTTSTSTSTTSTTSTSTTIGLVTIEDVRSKINFNLQDDAEILRPEEKNLAISHAVRVYSKDRPLEKIKEDDTANGTKYDFDLPYDWIEDFSTILGRIEYPVSNDIQVPQYVDDNNWIIYKRENGSILRFLGIIPSSGYDLRYTYVIPHTVSDTDCTVYENDFDAVCELATGLCYRALAAKYAQTEEPTIEADVIDYARKTDEYISLAREAFQNYARHMGKLPEEQEAKPGAMAVKDLDIQFPWAFGYLTHPKGWR